MSAGKMTLLVNIVLYVILGLGMGMVFQSSLRCIRDRIKLRKRLRLEKKREKHRLEIAADRLVLASIGRENGGKTFICVSFLCGLMSYLAAVSGIGAGYALLIAMEAAAIPFTALKLRVLNRRKMGSREGEAFLAEFYGKYMASSGNLDMCLELVAEEEGDNSICRQLTRDMLRNLRSSGDLSELRRCGDIFSYTIGTNWAELFAYNIGLGASESLNISSALEDIIIQLREARKLAEERKRLNSEATRLVLFMVPVSYIATVFFSVRYLGNSLPSLLRYQFTTGFGVLLFFSICFLFLLNMLIIAFVSHEKFDY